MDVLESIHAQAYANMVDMPQNMQGWMDEGSFMRFYNEALAGAGSSPLVVEVGSWKGLSACKMAKVMQASGLNGRIVAVDTWIGSPEHMRMEELGPREMGVPQIYRQFIANVQHNGLQQYIYPFPISSTQGGHFLETNGVRPDIVYIDAGHEYEAVRLDIQIFWRVLKPGGTMILDDYLWDGVKKAIHEFVDQVSVQAQVQGNVVKIVKPVP